MSEHGVDQQATGESKVQPAMKPELVDELKAIVASETKEAEGGGERLRVLAGLSEVRAGRLSAGEPFRFLVTATVQARPEEVGRFLGSGQEEFSATDRPVNTSLIDQDHTWTFSGQNGFILAPPSEAEAVIAALPYDFGSNDLDPQPITQDADELLASTPQTGYNHVNVASGRIEGIFIRLSESGEELGDTQKNQELRVYAQEHNLPVVEIPVTPADLHFAETTMQELPAKEGGRLWKIRLPQEGKLLEVDIVHFAPGDTAKGMQIDEAGFDLRIQDIDAYGHSITMLPDHNDPAVLLRVQERISAMLQSELDDDSRQACQAVLDRIQSML